MRGEEGDLRGERGEREVEMGGERGEGRSFFIFLFGVMKGRVRVNEWCLRSPPSRHVTFDGS